MEVLSAGSTEAGGTSSRGQTRTGQANTLPLAVTVVLTGRKIFSMNARNRTAYFEGSTLLMSASSLPPWETACLMSLKAFSAFFGGVVRLQHVDDADLNKRALRVGPVRCTAGTRRRAGGRCRSSG